MRWATSRSMEAPPSRWQSSVLVPPTLHLRCGKLTTGGPTVVAAIPVGGVLTDALGLTGGLALARRKWHTGDW